MSRHGYSDDYDNWEVIRWRGAVESAIRGKRGQQMLRDLAVALDAMPEKRLAEEQLVTETGARCALGVLGASRGIDLTEINPEDEDAVARAFGIAAALAREIAYENDECIDFWDRRQWKRGDKSLEEQRWEHVRKWAGENIRE